MRRFRLLLKIALGTFCLFVLVLGVVGWLAYRALTQPGTGTTITVSRETTYIDGPLDTRGYPDYVAALNEMTSAGVTPENNAAVLLCRALGPSDIQATIRAAFYEALGIEPLPDEGDYLVGSQESDASEAEQEEFSERLNKAMEEPWNADEFPDVAQWLEANEKSLELIVEASRRPRCWFPLVRSREGESLLEIPMLRFGNIRVVARQLLARAMLRLGRGDVDGAWADLLACHRLARLVGQGPSLIDALVGIGIDDMACAGDFSLAHHGNPTAEQAGRFLADLNSLSPPADMVKKIDRCERFTALDVVVSMSCGGDELGDFAQWPFSQASHLAVDWDEILRIVNRHFDRTVEAARLPTRPQRQEAFERIEAELDAARGQSMLSMLGSMLFSPRKMLTRKIGDIMAVLLSPATEAVLGAAQRQAASQALARITLALAAHRADHGQYPDGLGQLAPAYLPELPHDPCADAPFKYARQEGGYLLYSIGANGQDDGGKSYRIDRGDPNHDDITVRFPSSPARGDSQ